MKGTLARFTFCLTRSLLQPLPDSYASKTFGRLDWLFLTIFTVELAVNLFCTGFALFWQDGAKSKFACVVQICMRSLIDSNTFDCIALLHSSCCGPGPSQHACPDPHALLTLLLSRLATFRFYRSFAILCSDRPGEPPRR